MWWLFGYTEKIHTPSRPIKDPNKNNPNNKIKELQERCNKLERALDKSCELLANGGAVQCKDCSKNKKCTTLDVLYDCDFDKMTRDDWKEWCLND